MWIYAVLRNRNFFSGSVTVSAPYIDHKKQFKILWSNLAFKKLIEAALKTYHLLEFQFITAPVPQRDSDLKW